VHGFAQHDCYLKQTSVSVGLKRQFTDSLARYQCGRSLVIM